MLAAANSASRNTEFNSLRAKTRPLGAFLPRAAMRDFFYPLIHAQFCCNRKTVPSARSVSRNGAKLPDHPLTAKSMRQETPPTNLVMFPIIGILGGNFFDVKNEVQFRNIIALASL
ncbi:MAG TPA: hypothetical protein VGG10_05795 [Rhizomicrobium sp.]|jgi:hypothetical protein